jgi:hypothetical protein
MGCNCKNPSVDTEELEVEKTNKVKIGNTILNFILFLVLTCVVIPFVIPFIIYVLFKTIVLKNNNNNLIPMLLKVSKKIIGNEDEGKTDEDYQVYENNEYELMDVESVNN